MNEYIYEVIDATDECCTYTRGFHLNEADAIYDAKNSVGNGNLIFQEEFAIIEIRRYVAGSGDHHETILTLKWGRDEDWKWEEIKP